MTEPVTLGEATSAPVPAPAAPGGAVPAQAPAGRGWPTVRPPVHELGALLDRVDARTLPATSRAIAIVRARMVGLAAREIGRVRRTRDRARPSPAGSDDDDGPPALLDVAGVTPGGVVEWGVRMLVLGLVALIVVSATAAILQGVDHAPSSGRSSPATGEAPTSANQPAAPDQPAAPVLPVVTIGPGPNDPVADYLGASRQNLASLTSAAPGADLYAVASLTAPRTPADLLEVFGDFRTVQVFFTAGIGGEQEQALVRDPVADVRAAFGSAAAQADARAAADTQVGDTAAADRERRAASDLRAGCGCLFAAVVRAPAGRLSQLETDPRVRVVDPAPPGSGPPGMRFIPLSPDRR
ncbi:hypothetical protein [Frankia sp. CcWB3]